MKKAVYPGSFDPATRGHLDIIRRSAKLVDHLVVAVLNNINKKSLFTAQERVDLLKELTEDLPNVSIMSFSGLLVDFMVQEEADVLIRGFRAISDYEYEIQLAHTNYSLNPDIETIFLVTRNEYSFLSSSIVKEVAKFGGDVSKMVCPQTEIRLKNKYDELEETKMSDVLNLVDEMEGYFEECKTVPFSNKVVVDMEVMYEFMTDLRLKLPEEIKRSQRILEEKERIIEDARKEAASAEARAAARVDELVDEHKISKLAQEKAESIVAQAKQTADDIKLGAYEYAEEIVEQIELAMKDTLEQASHHYAKFDHYLAQQIKVMESNREELVLSKNRASHLEE